MSLNSAMEAARNAAAATPSTGTDVAVANGNSAAPAILGTGLDDFLSGGMQVDLWLQLKDAGIRLNREEKAFIDKFDAQLDVSSVQFFHGIRAELGGSAQYAKTYDGGRTTSKGENWASVYSYMKENGVKFSDTYRGADMVFVLTADVTQGKAVIPAGTRIGYTTPITGFSPFQNVVKQLVADGRANQAGGGRLDGPLVDVSLTHEVGTNKQNQDYGILKIELAD